MLEKGDSVPHFDVTTVQDALVAYSRIWQHKNLVLVVLPVETSPAVSAYVSALTAHLAEFSSHRAECVVTRDSVPGIPAPATLVADQWGEIVFVAAAENVDALPSPRDLLDWAEYVQRRCPECQGETR